MIWLQGRNGDILYFVEVLEFNVKIHCEINVALNYYFMKYSERKISQCILLLKPFIKLKEEDTIGTVI